VVIEGGTSLRSAAAIDSAFDDDSGGRITLRRSPASQSSFPPRRTRRILDPAEAITPPAAQVDAGLRGGLPLKSR
jgi:hypothetical protein